MNCSQARSLFSLYLDGALTGRQMQSLGAHFEECAVWSAGVHTVAPEPAFADVRGTASGFRRTWRLKVRIALSQEMARGASSTMAGDQRCWWKARCADSCFPPAVGLVTAVIVFGVLMGSFAGSVAGGEYE